MGKTRTLTGIEMKGGLAKDGPDQFRPFVLVSATGIAPDGETEVLLEGQISVEEVRRMALLWLEVAEAADQDRIVMMMLMRDFNVSFEGAGSFIAGMREERAIYSEQPDEEKPDEASPGQVLSSDPGT
jgi:hypothetical protein